MPFNTSQNTSFQSLLVFHDTFYIITPPKSGYIFVLYTYSLRLCRPCAIVPICTSEFDRLVGLMPLCSNSLRHCLGRDEIPGNVRDLSPLLLRVILLIDGIENLSWSIKEALNLNAAVFILVP